ncbi:polysaccharide deacetylase family protein [Streptomyces sp. RB6PN25]|uniref:Polysaccharide deacetylase family protein n=1 Tax=Streptomyces humicola TaxID=2953240 RepID=A0ABT1PU48_9ACTN|nr:polysaccharide deacetylase family protein [Streptomyces humicola]MCQ4080045.1 polysaccharide deacetylase family protein [Streptomyces humicola]
MTRTPISRRTLLSAGGLLLLSGCSDSGATHASAPARPTTEPTMMPGDSHRGGTPQPGAAGKRPTTQAPEFYVEDGSRAIALTIDDGPDPQWTPQVLDLLGRYGITATFCQVGIRAAADPALVHAVADHGHLVANHTWTHADLAAATPAGVREQLERTSDMIESISGQRPRLFRAPYGAWTQSTFAACRALGMRPLDWSVDPRDWARPGVSRIAQTILRTTRPGSIILEHDGGGDRSQTLSALRIVLPRLLDAGYHFVTP